MKLFHHLYTILEKFKSVSNKKERVIAFVDYEHWYYSYKNFFHLKPNVTEWRKQLEEKYQIEDIMVFGNFEYVDIREELNKIRSITNSIIETQQYAGVHEKDMTDFIMLDYIYQYVVEQPDVETYILFTGDAHFQSVIKYLIQKCNKKVVIYGVRNAFSGMLKIIATEAIEVPATEDVIKSIYPLIVDNMNYVSDKYTIVPTFLATASAISKKHNIPEELVKIALNEMLNKRLIYKRQQIVDFNRSVTVLAADWERLNKEGMWDY